MSEVSKEEEEKEGVTWEISGRKNSTGKDLELGASVEGKCSVEASVSAVD